MSDNADFILKDVQYDKDVVTGEPLSDKATYTFYVPEFDYNFIIHNLHFLENDDEDENGNVSVTIEYDAVQCIDNTDQNRSIDAKLAHHIIELFCQSLLWKVVEQTTQGMLNHDGNE